MTGSAGLPPPAGNRREACSCAAVGAAVSCFCEPSECGIRPVSDATPTAEKTVTETAAAVSSGWRRRGFVSIAYSPLNADRTLRRLRRTPAGCRKRVLPVVTRAACGGKVLHPGYLDCRSEASPGGRPRDPRPRSAAGRIPAL